MLISCEPAWSPYARLGLHLLQVRNRHTWRDTGTSKPERAPLHACQLEVISFPDMRVVCRDWNLNFDITRDECHMGFADGFQSGVPH